jgi:hypothetical protein
LKKALPAILLVLGLCGLIRPTAEPPQITLSNGMITSTLYLPDTAQGYYRGTRFDWAGAFKNLDYNGHSYVEQWFEKYDPYLHDAINGPTEEFTPLGFTEAKPGDTFVKIGVGVLRKANDKAYSFATVHKVANYGKRTIKTHKSARFTDAVEFTHELTDATGYGYRYSKTVKLVKGKPELVLEHRLKNTGQKVIETSVYNHNFWIIDQQITGPTVAIRFPFAVTGEGKGFGTTIVATDKGLTYTRNLDKREQVYSAGLQGFGPTEDSYDIRIENLKTGAGLHATGDHPLEKLVYWACATTSCPEPYIHLKAKPGEEVTWTIKYEFYQTTAP